MPKLNNLLATISQLSKAFTQALFLSLVFVLFITKLFKVDTTLITFDTLLQITVLSGIVSAGLTLAQKLPYVDNKKFILTELLTAALIPSLIFFALNLATKGIYFSPKINTFFNAIIITSSALICLKQANLVKLTANDFESVPLSEKPRKNKVFSYFFNIKIQKIALYIVVILFILLKIYVLKRYNGSYSDEYYHITSGLNYISTGKFAEIYHGEIYNREGYFSIIVGVFLNTFGKNILVAKIVPAIFGIVNLGLLLYLGKQIYKKTYALVILTLVYTFLPWVILNHFYVRFYVFLEFIILLTLSLYQKHKTSSQKWCVFLIILINALFFVFGRGAASNLVNAFSLSLFLFDQIFEGSNGIFRYITKYKKISLFILIGLVCIAFASSNFLLYSFKELFYGQLKYANTDLNYYKLFFNVNVVLSIFVLINTVSILKNADVKTKSSLLAFLSISALHLVSNPEAHTVRAVFYLMPLFLLFSIYLFNIDPLVGYKSTFYNFTLKFLLLINIAVTVIHNYPLNFLEHPYINTEIMYYDNSIYKITSERCIGSLIITSNRPEILSFNRLKSDYYLNTQYSNDEWIQTDSEASYSYLDPSDGKYYYTYTKTPVLKNIDEFKDAVSQQDNACLLTGLMPYDWIDQETRAYIDENFILAYTGKASTYRNALRLYIKR